MSSPIDRSRAALPENIRKTLEESNLPVEVATAIADLCDGLIRPEARAIEALQTVREMIRGQQIEHQVVNFDHPAIGLGQWLDSFLPQRQASQLCKIHGVSCESWQQCEALGICARSPAAGGESK